MNRSGQRKRRVSGAFVVGGLTLAVLTCQSNDALAATITVNATCSLTQAVSAVNLQQVVGGCAAGTGSDAIKIAANSTISQATSLVIKRSVTIQSSVANQKARIEAAGLSTPLRLFEIAPLAGTTPTVTFNDILFVGDAGVRGIHATTTGPVGALSMNQCEFSNFGESAVFSIDFGVTAVRSYFHGNRGEHGAAIRIESLRSSNLVVNLSSFIENEASNIGGAMMIVSNGIVLIVSSTFTKNSAEIGGALAFYGTGTASIRASTIAGNYAQWSAGGGMNNNKNVTFIGTILADNTINQDPGLPSDWDHNSTINLFTDSLLKSRNSVNATGAGNNIPINSIGANSIINVPGNPGDIVSLSSYDLGGPLNPSPPTLRISTVPSVSPAIDALSSSPTNTLTDQRGFQRGVAASAGATKRFDIGAVEYDPYAQAESLRITKVVNGTVSAVVDQVGFLPTLGSDPGKGKGILFVPTGGAIGASLQVHLPIINGGGGTGLRFHVQSCPTCGTYRIDVQDSDATPPPVVQLGTLSFSSSTTKTVTIPATGSSALSLAPLLGAISVEENDNLEIKFTLVSKPANSNGQLILDFIKIE